MVVAGAVVVVVAGVVVVVEGATVVVVVVGGGGGAVGTGAGSIASGNGTIPSPDPFVTLNATTRPTAAAVNAATTAKAHASALDITNPIMPRPSATATSNRVMQYGGVS